MTPIRFSFFGCNGTNEPKFNEEGLTVLGSQERMSLVCAGCLFEFIKLTVIAVGIFN